MSRVFSSLVMLLLIWAPGDRAAPAPGTLRVLTYNIHHGEGTDGRFDLPRVAGVIRRVAPDLVALQEVDQGTERAGGVHQLAELERMTGLHGEFGKAMDFSGGSYGVAVLSRWPLMNVRNEPLPRAADREPRTALTVQARPGEGGPLLQFTSTHFDQGRDEQLRLDQASFLTGLHVADDLPAILAGDLNSRPDTEVMKTLQARWTNAFFADPASGPDGRPRFRADHVLFQPADRWRVVETTVVDDRLASDHRPVLVVLELTERR